MRSLATGTYTAAQVSAQLSSANYAFGFRFDLLDQSNNLLGPLALVSDHSIEVSADRDVKGSLALTLLADPNITSTNAGQRRIKPWFRLVMPDGGIAEFPMGVFMWRQPQRTITKRGVEVWKTTLADLGGILTAGGPGPGGTTFPAGMLRTDAIIQVLQLIGFVDTSGVVPSVSTIGSTVTFDLVDVNGNTTRWLDVLNTLLPGGYYSPSFDGTGRPIIKPQPDLTTATSGVSYLSGGNLVLGIVPNDDYSSFANRCTRRAANTGGLVGIATADANFLVPSHPWNQMSIGYYIDGPAVNDSAAATQADLQAGANADLLAALTAYQTITLSTLAWPVHEAFDVVTVGLTGDRELDPPQQFHEGRWTINAKGVMAHDLRRMIQAA